MDKLPLTILDIVVLAVVAVSALSAFIRGGVREILGLGSWVGAAVVAFLAYPTLQPMARAAIAQQLAADVVAAGGAFLLALIALKLIVGGIARMIEGSALGSLDKLLGLAFGVARGAAVVCVVYLVASYLIEPARQPAWVQEAYLIGPIRDGAAWIGQHIPESYRDEGLAAVGGAAVDAASQALEAASAGQPAAIPSPSTPKPAP